MTTQKTKSPPYTPKKWVDVRLNSPDHVRRLLSKLINMSMKDQLETEKLRGITYSFQTLLRVFELILVENKLSDIEAKIDEIRSTN